MIEIKTKSILNKKSTYLKYDRKYFMLSIFKKNVFKTSRSLEDLAFSTLRFNIYYRKF